MIVLTIDEPTPSVNYAHGHHWSRKLKLRKRWAWLVKAAMLNAGLHTPPRFARARLTIERYGPRSLDSDNFRAGTKWLQDSLVAEGIITDDTPAVIGEPVLRQFVGKERKTIVRVEAA
jgi:hypothetical protein